eukprot:evm.model.NODE_31920_length_36224_cov_28.324261.2
MPGLTFPAYFALSSSLTALAVSYAFHSRSQFYPAVIYLVTSKLSVLVLGNMGLMLTLLAGRVMKSVFFGQLRDVEVELLYDNARYAVTETCLALTIFREELTDSRQRRSSSNNNFSCNSSSFPDSLIGIGPEEQCHATRSR